MKKEFISKWSSWWRLQKRHEELTEAFERELNSIIEQEVAGKNFIKPDVIKSVCDFCGAPLTEQTDRCDRCWDEYSKKVKQTVL